MSFGDTDEDYVSIAQRYHTPVDISGPIEDYDIPFVKCFLCESDSLRQTIAFVDDSNICCKAGDYIHVKSYKNTYLCYQCIDKLSPCDAANI